MEKGRKAGISSRAHAKALCRPRQSSGPPGHRCTRTLSRAPLSHSRSPPVPDNRLPSPSPRSHRALRCLLLAWRALVMYRIFLAAIHQRANSAANAAVIIYARFMSDSASVCPRACTSRSREARGDVILSKDINFRHNLTFLYSVPHFPLG
jgi:hypothetical protein